MVVYVEDCSGNGTTINQTTVLRKGEKLRLHSGDEICLVNCHNLRKKIRSATELQKLLQPYSYVFVLLQQNPMFSNNLDEPLAASKTITFMAEVTGRNTAMAVPANSPHHHNNKTRKAAVNVRATQQSHHRSPRHLPFPLPQPRRNNHHMNHNLRPLTDRHNLAADALFSSTVAALR